MTPILAMEHIVNTYILHLKKNVANMWQTDSIPTPHTRPYSSPYPCPLLHGPPHTPAKNYSGFVKSVNVKYVTPFLSIFLNIL